ncbi:hypothetical protein [Propioniferax innocua]|uniref:hypothetical protein n=1 Tax=Propioniferax innocua TaxID=1753 RepID=UPI0014775471|nr:hypothetical protein [Propioniferax innocua]
METSSLPPNSIFGRWAKPGPADQPHPLIDITEEDLEEERRYNEWLSEVTDPKRHT